MMALRPNDVRRLALALPESTEAPHHDMTSFRVGGKLFATMPPEGDRLHVFVGEDEVVASCAEYPLVVTELRWGKKLAGCRVALAGADADLVRELLAEAWRRKAPKRLVADFDS